MKKIIGWTIVVIIIGFLAFFAWKSYQRSQIQTKEVTVEEKTKPVEIKIVDTQPLVYSLHLTGNIEGIEEIDVFPKVSGKLLEVKVKEGDRVEKDQVIAIIDRDVTGMKFEPASVKAPAEGIVGRVYLDKGAGVSPPSPSPNFGTALVRIVNMDEVKVVVDVIEKDLPKIKLGQKANIKVDAYPDQTFTGKISLVSPMVDLRTRTAEVEITLSNPAHKLKPGMFAEVEVIMGRKEKTILIPSHALSEESENRKIFILVGGKAVSRYVTLGTDLGDMIEIIQGLSLGDTLIVSGQHSIEEGDSLRIVSSQGYGKGGMR